MGGSFIWYFYNEKRERIQKSEYFKLGHVGYVHDTSFDSVYRVFSSYLEKRRDGELMFGPYTLEEIGNCINEAGKNFTPKQLMTCYPDLSDVDDLLREIYQLSQVLQDAEWHNENSDDKIVYISFGYI